MIGNLTSLAPGVAGGGGPEQFNAGAPGDRARMPFNSPAAPGGVPPQVPSPPVPAPAVQAPASRGGPADSPPDAAELVRVLALVADGTRLRILFQVAGGEQSVSAITAALGLPQPTISHHLAWLKTMRLVASRRRGKNVFYGLGDAARAGDDGSLSLLTEGATVRIGRRTET